MHASGYPKVVSWTHCNIDVIHAKCCKKQVYAEDRPDHQRDWQNERSQEIKQCLVDLLENEEFSTNLPESEFPGKQDVSHVVVHSVDEEEIPSVKALTKNGHLTEAAAATAREEDGGGCFCLYEDGSAHRNTTSEFSSCMAEEPIFRDRESGMRVSKCARESLLLMRLTQGGYGMYRSRIWCPRSIWHHGEM